MLQVSLIVVEVWELLLEHEHEGSDPHLTSADPYIQAPENTQSFNRYSYVMNNPLKYVDPSGYFFSGLRHAFHKAVHAVVHVAESAVSWVADHAKDIATAAIVVASGGLGFAVAGAMGGGLAAAAIGGAVAGFGAGAGITLLNGGSLSQAFRNGAKGAIFGAISGAAAFGVGHMIFNSNVGSLLNPGSGGYGAAFEKAVMHGIVRAGMASLRGQKVSAGFWSGFVSSGFSVGTSGYGGTPGRTFIMAVVGGTTSELTGGKFANGAVTGAFVHLFNDEWRIGKWKTYKVENPKYKPLLTLQMGAIGGTLWMRTATLYQFRENYLMCENDCTQQNINYEYRVLNNHIDFRIGPAVGINFDPNANPKKAQYDFIGNPWTGEIILNEN